MGIPQAPDSEKPRSDFSSLPCPYPALAEVLSRHAEISSQLLAAQTAGHKDRAFRLELDLSDAQDDLRRIRGQVADLLFMQLRYCSDIDPKKLNDAMLSLPCFKQVKALREAVKKLAKEFKELREFTIQLRERRFQS